MVARIGPSPENKLKCLLVGQAPTRFLVGDEFGALSKEFWPPARPREVGISLGVNPLTGPRQDVSKLKFRHTEGHSRVQFAKKGDMGQYGWRVFFNTVQYLFC